MKVDTKKFSQVANFSLEAIFFKVREPLKGFVAIALKPNRKRYDKKSVMVQCTF